MIVQLNKVHTDLSILLDVPTSFFEKVEAATSFGDNLFPDWFDAVFGSTKARKDSFYKKFEKLYDKYKTVPDKNRRGEIVKAYSDGIQVENLCNRAAGVSAKKLSEFTEVKDEMRAVLKHLWENSLTYQKFEEQVGTDVHQFVNEFLSAHNEISVCPFCGLEGYTNLSGQSRMPLDHWMCKEKYPYSFVNFENLVPIGKSCNESPAKGAKDVTTLTTSGRAFYPFTKHNSITVEIVSKKTPTNPIEEDGIYEVIVNPQLKKDNDLFESWDKLFNIRINYNSYFKKTLLNSWRAKYKSFIDNHSRLNHPESLDDFKLNLRDWQDSIQPLIQPGYLIFHAFVTNLLSQPDSYLYGLMQYFKRQ